jgi:hypothetical protein
MTADPLVRSRWAAVIQKVGAKRAALASTLLNSTVRQLDERVLHIEVPQLRAFQKTQLGKPANSEMVMAAVEEEFGRPLVICYHAPRVSPLPGVPIGGTQDVNALGIALARLMVASPRASRGAQWGLRTEMTLAEIAGERGVLNELLEAHRLLMRLRALAEQGEARR